MVKYLLDQKCAIIFCVYFRENLPECQHHNTRFSRITKHCMSFAWNTIDFSECYYFYIYHC